MMMMMAYSVDNARAYQQPRLAGVGVYGAPTYGYRPQDEGQAFVAPLATTVTVGAIGAGGVALWENANAPKRFASTKFDEAVKAELANNPTTTPATPKNPTSGFNPTQAHEKVMKEYLEGLKNADTSDVFTPNEIKRLSKQHLGDVRAAIAKKTGGDALATAFDTAFSTKKVTGDKLTAYERLSAYDKAIDTAARQQHYDNGLREILGGQKNSKGVIIYQDSKNLPPIADRVALEAELDRHIGQHINDLELDVTKNGTISHADRQSIDAKKAQLNNAKDAQLKKFDELEKVKARKVKLPSPKTGNSSSTEPAKSTGSKLTEAEARTNVLNETTGKKVTKAQVETLFKDGKVSTPTDAGKAAMETFNKNAIEKGGFWETKGKSMATKAGGILAGAAVIGTIAGVVNSNNVQQSNKAQLEALMAQERMASA
jgi:hypothetical protein